LGLPADVEPGCAEDGSICLGPSGDRGLLQKNSVKNHASKQQAENELPTELSDQCKILWCKNCVDRMLIDDTCVLDFRKCEVPISWTNRKGSGTGWNIPKADTYVLKAAACDEDYLPGPSRPRLPLAATPAPTPEPKKNTTTTTTTRTQDLSKGFFIITSDPSKERLCVDAWGEQLKSDVKLGLWPCKTKNNLNQRFLFDDGFIKLYGNQQLCFNVIGGNIRDGAAIKTWTCSKGQDNDLWVREGSQIRLKKVINLCMGFGADAKKESALQLTTCSKKTEILLQPS